MDEADLTRFLSYRAVPNDFPNILPGSWSAHSFSDGNRAVASLLRTSVLPEKCFVEEGVFPDSMSKGFFLLESQDWTVSNIVIHPARAKDFILLGPMFFDVCATYAMRQNGLLGSLWTASVWTSREIEENEVYLLATAEFLGDLLEKGDRRIAIICDPRAISKMVLSGGPQ